MLTTEVRRIFTEEVSALVGEEVRLKGWVHRLRILGKTAFIILRDCTGEAQCVIASEALKAHKLKAEDVVEIIGTLRSESRARTGSEVEISEIHVLNPAGQNLPFQSAANVESVGLDSLLQYRPLSLRTETVGDIFRVQAAILASFRDALNRQRFTEIVTSKIVSSGTEGGSNLFEIKYCIYLPYLKASRIRSLQIGLDKIFLFGYCEMDECRWRPSEGERSAGRHRVRSQARAGPSRATGRKTTSGE